MRDFIIKYFFRNVYNTTRYLNIPKNVPIKTNYQSNVDKSTLLGINKYRKNPFNVPIVINGKEYEGEKISQRCPYEHSSNVCNYNYATKEHIKIAIDNTENGKSVLRKLSLLDKQMIFNKLSDWITNKYETDILASTIYGQGKTIHQAEIDAVCELSDFLRFNSFFFKEMTEYQPYSTNSGKVVNISEWQPLNGFVASITPFNFTAIGGNLASAPALLGNYVIWKPSDNAILSNYVFYNALLEAGMPPEAVSFVPSNPELFLDKITKSSDLGGIAFTGSSMVFDNVWKNVGNNISLYNNYPRIVGETGGMNFHFVFNDADPSIIETIRGAFEYSGQKCSATSRLYLPRSIANIYIEKLLKELSKMKIGSPESDDVFTSAVINERAYHKITNFIDRNKDKIIYGGKYDDDIGYYVYPTIFMCDDHESEVMNEEVFGPVLGIYVYDDDKVEETLYKCSNNKYGLTGSIFTTSASNVMLADKYLYNSCGNYYINDKCTGSVVCQQPFGGSKKSGTNDKAGSKNFLTRFANNRIVKVN